MTGRSRKPDAEIEARLRAGRSHPRQSACVRSELVVADWVFDSNSANTSR